MMRDATIANGEMHGMKDEYEYYREIWRARKHKKED